MAAGDPTMELRPEEFIAECPECGAQAIGDDLFMPGHLHDIDTEHPYFVQYERAVERPKRGRPRKVEAADA